MAEQTFRSPGFFERELDRSAPTVTPNNAVPAGIIGTSEKGPAFVPVTVGNKNDFKNKFGNNNIYRFGPYAAEAMFGKNQKAITFIRVLGAGANDSVTDISNTLTQGTVKNAGFVLKGNDGHSDAHVPPRSNLGDPNSPTQTLANLGSRKIGSIQFLTAIHSVNDAEPQGFPIFTDNRSTPMNASVPDGVADGDVSLLRAVLMTPSGSTFLVGDHDAATADDYFDTASTGDVNQFKLLLTSSSGAGLGSDLNAGSRLFDISLDPNADNYISRVLNTNPLKFQEEEHLLYLDFAVENEIAPVKTGGGAANNRNGSTVALLMGSNNNTAAGGISNSPFRDLFGRYDTRYQTARTSAFISQPYGSKEYELFHFETIDDGASASDEFKVSIANLRASNDESNPYGTFEVQIRSFSDSDKGPEILERYPFCNLNPSSDDFVAKKIGDYKARYDFDQADPDERRIVVTGRYPNMSSRVRIVINEDVYSSEVPSNALPFGFKGIPVLRTSNTLTDRSANPLPGGTAEAATARLAAPSSGIEADESPLALQHAVVPPLPFTFKVTRGELSQAAGAAYLFTGMPSDTERVDSAYYWGVKTTRLPRAVDVGSDATAVRRSNESSIINPLVRAYTKFQGIEKLDVLVTGSSNVDDFNDNKFTLARVAFSQTGTDLGSIQTDFSGSAREHMKDAAYIRNGEPNTVTYTVNDIDANGRLNGAVDKTDRFTMASLLATSSIIFNRFSSYAKFTNIFYGGFDGVNILDRDQTFFRDRALSADSDGKARKVTGAPEIVDNGIAVSSATENPFGSGRKNNYVASINRAIDIMTDPTATRVNILAIPGVREPFVTDHALEKTKQYGQALYVMDSIQYDELGNRLYDDSAARPDVRETSEKFEARGLDNNYGATYFPDVFISDQDNNQVVKMPSSIPALATLSNTDDLRAPWFAPAGFARGALDFVVNVDVRLSSEDRDVLYDSRINPIAVFPRAGFVIFGQKTLQQAKSALDRVNVRRLMVEVKRKIVGIALNLLFEPNNGTTRATFISEAASALANIQLGAGIESFNIVMDDSNNSQEDIDSNRLNGRIEVVPTRAVEFIAIDFVITNSGVEFN